MAGMPRSGALKCCRKPFDAARESRSTRSCSADQQQSSCFGAACCLLLLANATITYRINNNNNNNEADSDNLQQHLSIKPLQLPLITSQQSSPHDRTTPVPAPAPACPLSTNSLCRTTEPLQPRYQHQPAPCQPTAFPLPRPDHVSSKPDHVSSSTSTCHSQNRSGRGWFESITHQPCQDG